VAQPSAMQVHEWLELLASIEHERRTYRARAEIFSELANVVKAAGFMARADETAKELAETRAEAIADGVPTEAITPELVEAWGIANLDGGPYHVWDWDTEQDLPTSLE
jgi:hypothetical protein